MGNSKDKKALATAADLRRRAEKLLKTSGADSGFYQGDANELRFLHELQIHQIELEMQNAELLQARDEIESALEKYTDLYDFAPVAYFTLDQVGLIRAANLTAASFLGIERSLLLGGRFSQFVVNEHRQLFAEFLRKVFASQGKESCEVILTTGSNPPPCVLIEAIVLSTRQECRVAVIDITVRKQAEKLLQDFNAELEKRVEQRTCELYETQKQVLHSEKLSVIGHLSASIAHEFNNPLQGILSVLNGLKRRATMEEEDSELLDSAISEGNRMKELIRSLQDFNRPSSGKQVMMDIHLTLNPLLQMHKSDFKGRRISVVLDYAEGLPQILAVPDQIKQVFLNLLANATDACKNRGGVVTVSTWQEDDRVAIAIKDTGGGIKPENMNLIFQPFFSTKSEVKGTGLGLSVSNGIINSHRGEIRVESQPGEGATFTVLLPVNGAEETASATGS